MSKLKCEQAFNNFKNTINSNAKWWSLNTIDIDKKTKYRLLAMIYTMSQSEIDTYTLV